MNRISISIISILFGLLILISCKKVLIGPDPKSDPETTFELLWKEMDQNYSFFELKNIDWNATYYTFRPQVTSETSPQALFIIISQMLNTLQDGHLNLHTPFGSSSYNYYKNSPTNFLGLGSLNGKIVNARHNNTILYGTLSQNVGYIYIGSFQNYQPGDFDIIDQIIQDFRNTQGLIIDIRNNGGGSDAMAQIIASRFTDTKRLYSYVRYKNGPQHNQFTDFQPNYLSPVKTLYSKPVIVLTNKRCYSTAETFVLMMKSIPGVVTVGDTTGGGSGNPQVRELPNGWTYRASRWIAYTSEKKTFEGMGLPPDHPVTITEQDSIDGFDRILEFAVTQITN